VTKLITEMYITRISANLTFRAGRLDKHKKTINYLKVITTIN